MAERPFDAGVRRRPELVVIDLHGDIDIEADQAMRSAYAEAASGPELAKARAEHRPITACGLSEHYRQIFEITRLADFMPIFPDEETAAQHEAPVQARRQP